MATLKDVVRQGMVLIVPMYSVPNKPIVRPVANEPLIEFDGIECQTLIELIELIEATPSLLPLIENDLQCLSELNDGTPMLSTWVQINDFKVHFFDLIIKAANEESKSILANQMKTWGQGTNNCTEVCFDFFRK
ncbi:hypothetical protein TUM4438_31120 [Shewanella sairae]|uniref:Uncharacterized protein n=1 Tax=Shewanella sairae TaxID=190310 RepID=A0ABQ4PLA7_9GAMM|nr:hypothetical protein [Shewanella sairae]MCL1131882.1 hypothetical protein [Shewanella sairae]GIU48839.1 hypothetical protein TUM4438_31120 [Shewanella sairae]